MAKFSKNIGIGGLDFTWDGETGQVIGATLNTESPARLRSAKCSAHDGVHEIKIILDCPPNEIKDREEEGWERPEKTTEL